jgi:hypothetical protein
MHVNESIDSGLALRASMRSVCRVLVCARVLTVACCCEQVLTYSLTRKDGGGSVATSTGAVFRATPEAGAVPVNGSCSIGFTCAASAAGDHELQYSLELSDRATSEKVGRLLCALSVYLCRNRGEVGDGGWGKGRVFSPFWGALCWGCLGAGAEGRLSFRERGMFSQR